MNISLTSISFLVALNAPLLLQNHLQASRSHTWADGHGDLEVSYINNEWHWTLEEGKTLDSVQIQLGKSSLSLIPDLPDFEFFGKPESPIWVIPQSSQSGVPFMRIPSREPA